MVTHPPKSADRHIRIGAYKLNAKSDPQSYAKSVRWLMIHQYASRRAQSSVK